MKSIEETCLERIKMFLLTLELKPFKSWFKGKHSPGKGAVQEGKQLT